MDDDVARNPYIGWEDDNIQNERHCRRTNWHRDTFLNCNTIHEIDREERLIDEQMTFLGEGSYREVHSFDLPVEGQFVSKAYRWDAEGGGIESYSYEDYEYMRIDALISEKFTSNPWFVDIYGFCKLASIDSSVYSGETRRLTLIISDSKIFEFRCTINAGRIYAPW